MPTTILIDYDEIDVEIIYDNPSRGAGIHTVQSVKLATPNGAVALRGSACAALCHRRQRASSERSLAGIFVPQTIWPWNWKIAMSRLMLLMARDATLLACTGRGSNEARGRRAARII